jgi:hypothetical protein
VAREQLERYTCDRCGAVTEVALGELQPQGWRHWKESYLTVRPEGHAPVATGEWVLCSRCDDLVAALIRHPIGAAS